jgi:MarR family transcriptional regulator, lower aerobic nicotinate degradation pathway regulator
MRPETPKIPIDQQTTFLLQWAHRRALRAFNSALRPLQIEARHLGALMALEATGVPLHQKQLAAQLELDKSSVVLIMDDLERLRMAQRRRDPRDRRAHVLGITDRGRECLGQAQTIAEQLSRTILAGISQTERKRLDAALWRIIRNCQALPE